MTNETEADRGEAAGGPSLPACPSSPNCVSSLATREGQRVAPLRFVGEPAGALAELARVVEAMPGGRVVHRDERSLRAEFRSRLWGFVDDLDCVADPAAGVLHVRSASRLGYWDLGANRRRIEEIRERISGDRDVG